MSLASAQAVVRDRSHGLCEICGLRGSQSHHRLPRGLGGVHGDAALVVNSAANLVRACTACHGWVEANRAEAFELGLLVHRGADPREVCVFLQTVNGEGWFHLTMDGNYLYCST